MTDAPLSIGFLSLGCPKNLVDSQLMAENLINNGFTLSPTPETADVIIINSCAFIEDAREESLDSIEAACQLKAAGDCRAVLVAGCMTQRYRKHIQDALPDVDGFIGLDNIDEVSSAIRTIIQKKTTAFSVSSHAKRIFDSTGNVVFSTGANAYLKIAEGCNHGCAFCAIPGIRGKHRSRHADDILREAETLLSKGFKELDIIAQDIMAYGNDLSPSTSLDRLLAPLSKLKGQYWIRLLYGYPSLLSDKLLDTMATHQTICNYVDIPIQHSHPDILRAMRRAGTITAVEEMPQKIGSLIPNACIRTTALVGFPGETDACFQHLREYLAEAQFDHVGVFCFSHEEGTIAADLPNPVDAEIAQHRKDLIMQDQQKRVQRRLQKAKEKADVVLIDAKGRKKGELRARNQGQAPDVDGVVWIRNVPADWRPGQFIPVTYTGFQDYDLLAKPNI